MHSERRRYYIIFIAPRVRQIPAQVRVFLLTWRSHQPLMTCGPVSALCEIPQFRDFVQQLLQVGITDLVCQTWYQGFGLLGALTAQTA